MQAIDIVRERFPHVQKVVDAKKSISIHVTKRDCNSQKVKNHQECAMAAAVKREKKVDGVMISLKSAYIIDGNRATRYRVPVSVAREVISFDRKAPFEPGEYRLAAPSPAVQLGARAERNGDHPTGRNPAPNGNLAKRFHHKTENVRTKLGTKEWRASNI